MGRGVFASMGFVLLVGCGGADGVVGGSVWSLSRPASHHARPDGDFLLAIWGTSSTDVFASGAIGTHFDGATWRDGSPAGVSIHGTGPTDVVIAEPATESGHCVGATLHHYDGTGWWTDRLSDICPSGVWHDRETEYVVGGYQDTPFPAIVPDVDPLLGGTDELTDVWGSGASLFVSAARGAIEHFDGATWTRATLPFASSSALWGVSPTEVYALGDGGLFRFDGHGWTLAADVAGADLFGTSADDVYVVGPRGSVWHFDGAAWTAMESPTTDDLTTGWASDDGEVFVVTRAGAIYVHHAGA